LPRSSGTYSLPAGQPVVTGTSISSSVFNTLTTDIANELTNSIPRDGTAPPTANLPMGNFKITGLANGTLSSDAATVGQLAGVIANAASVTSTPAGGISATNVQAALNELDTEKANLASPTFTGTPIAPTATAGTNTTQLATTAFVIANGVFASGTRMTFNQTSAPTGWTKDTTAALNDSIMRIVTGAVGSGGSNAFSTFNAQTATAGYTLATADIPSHVHSLGMTGQYLNNGTVQVSTTIAGSINGNTTTIPTNSGAQGGGGSHSHGVTTSIKYNDFIIASKD
jgi:hypothetical protein